MRVCEGAVHAAVMPGKVNFNVLKRSFSNIGLVGMNRIICAIITFDA